MYSLSMWTTYVSSVSVDCERQSTPTMSYSAAADPLEPLTKVVEEFEAYTYTG